MTRRLECDICHKLCKWPPQLPGQKMLDEGWYNFKLEIQPGFVAKESHLCYPCGDKLKEFIKTISKPKEILT
jgi:hypothetical protein